MDPARTQEGLLLGLLRRAARTRFGRAHGFDAIRSVGDFRARVPLRHYEAFWEDWWHDAFPRLTDVTWPGAVPYLATTSGTTSDRQKYIPVTRAMVRANRGAALDTLCWHLNAHPHSRVFAGCSLMLGGSPVLNRLDGGVREGVLSSIAAAEIPAWIRAWSWPRRDPAPDADWGTRLDLLAEAMPRERIRVVSGTAGWVLMLFERLAERAGMPPLPRLELLVHGAVPWPPYAARIAPYLPPGCATREVYPASEGFVAIADRGEGEGMRLNLDRGCFFEFVPVEELDAPDPTRHWAATVQTGVEYEVIVTSCAGLWAYRLGDTVRFVDRDPVPRLLVTGRTSYMMTAFGEHLRAEDIEAAVLQAAGALGIAVAEYTTGVVYRGSGGFHRYVIEPTAPAPPGAAQAMAAAIDAALHAGNANYARRRDARLIGGPEVQLVAPGAFLAWMESQGKAGGQHKVPRVITDEARFAAALRALDAHRGR